MKHFFFNPRYYFNGPSAVGIFILRVFLGYALVIHGKGKIQNPLGWMGPDGPPAFLQGFAAVAEFFGGLALMFGLLTPLACVGVMCMMFVAVLSHITRGEASFIGGKGIENNYELAGMYFLLALSILLTGPGILSVDAALAKMMGPRNAATPRL